MAVRHIEKPFFGIKFHPESVCSEPLAQQVIVNWWNICLEWTSVCHKLRLSTYMTGIVKGGGAALDSSYDDYLNRNLYNLDAPACLNAGGLPGDTSARCQKVS